MAVVYVYFEDDVDMYFARQLVNERLSGAITEHRGHVGTFIGDGILAFFGMLEPNPWQADDEVRAALAKYCEL